MKIIEMFFGSKYYIKNKEKITVLEEMNIKFEKGKLYAIRGKSGAGKSTLLNIIGTLDNLSNGKLLIDGQDVNSLSEDEKAQIRMKKIGLFFKNFT